MRLQHIVLFSFPQELSDADSTDMRRQVDPGRRRSAACPGCASAPT